jgi:hypothetical protein
VNTTIPVPIGEGMLPFGSAPMLPSGMTKRLWEYVKRHRFAMKG